MQVLPLPQSQGIGMEAGINSILSQILQKRQQQESAGQLNQILGSLGINTQGMNLTSPVAQQLMGNLALQEAKPTPDRSTDELLAVLLQAQLTGKTTPGMDAMITKLQEMKRASTNVTVNTGETVAALPSQLTDLKSGQSMIQEFVNNPDNKEILKNQDINLVSTPKGEMVLEVKPKDKPSATDVSERTKLELLRSKVNDIYSLKKKVKDSIGPIQGNIAKLEMWTTGGNPDVVALRQSLDSLILRAYMLSGKQISFNEIAFLQKMQPKLTDPIDTFNARLDGFFREVKTMAGIQDETWNQLGFRSPQKTTRQSVLDPNEVVIKDKNGNRFAIPKEQLNEAVKQGFKLSK